MSSQASLLEMTQAKLERMKVVFKADENKQKSKSAPRRKINKVKENTTKAVKRSAVDKLVEPAAKRVANHLCDVPTKRILKEATRPISPTKKFKISSAQTSSNAQLLKTVEKSVKQISKAKMNVPTKQVLKEITRSASSTKEATISSAQSGSNALIENKKSVSEISQPKIISSLVESIINEMDEQNQTLTKSQTKRVKAVVKKAATPKTTSPEKHVTWTEADLEKFGFVFFVAYEAFNSSEQKKTIFAKDIIWTEADLEKFGIDFLDEYGSFDNACKINNEFAMTKTLSSNTITSEVHQADTIECRMFNNEKITAVCPLQLIQDAGESPVVTRPDSSCSLSMRRNGPQTLETNCTEIYTSSISSNSCSINDVSSHRAKSTQLNSATDVVLCPLQLALESEEWLFETQPDMHQSTSTPTKEQQALETSWSEFNNLSFSFSITDVSSCSTNSTNNATDVAICPLQLALEADTRSDTAFYSTPKKAQQNLDISWSEFNTSLSSNSCSENDLSSLSTRTTQPNCVSSVALCPLQLALEAEELSVETRTDSTRFISTSTQGQQASEYSWSEFNLSLSSNDSSSRIVAAA